jgi:hypothetical protein
MARFILLSPVWGCPPSLPSGRKWPTFTTICDVAANQLPGDVIFPSLINSASTNPALAPLDAAALAVANSIFTSVVTKASIVTGNLTDAYGTTLDAGD